MNLIVRAGMRFFAVCFFCLSAGTFCCAAGDAPPVDLQVYYSAEDPAWAAAEKTIDAVCLKFPRIRMEKVCIDNAEGYKKLAETEKRLNIVDPGEITLVMGPLHLISRGSKRDVEKYFEGFIGRMLNPEAAKGKKVADAAGYAVEVFGAGAAVDGKADEKEHITYYQVMKDGARVGWVVDAFQHIHCPVCNDTQFLMAVGEPGLKTIGLRPVRALELKGTALDPKEGEKFLNQFIGRTPPAPNATAVQVDIISGATTTSHTYDGAVNEILTELRTRAKK